jgi:hypothetical protein
MKTTNKPQSLPFLPGNVYGDPTITRYHKTQLFGIKDGTITGKSLLVVTKMADPQFRKDSQFTGKHQRRTPDLNARRQCNWSHWCPQTSQARKRLDTQSRASVAQV